jgi:cell division protein FtsW (lipid II flippase)
MPVVATADMPDLSRRITKMNAAADRASSWGVARLLLAVVAVEVIALSLYALIVGTETEDARHAARHLGSFSLAYGVMLVLVVMRPARARTALPVVMVVAGALVITAIVDLATGSIPLVDEALHIPEVVSVVLIWLLAVPVGRRRLPWRRDVTTSAVGVPPRLHVVESDDSR